MKVPVLSRSVYFGLYALLALVYFCGLFVPLMDNDSAHHANIALHMHLTGDYGNLVSDDGEYFDKPHFLFWITALSYQLFGVTSFAYRFPSFLFTIFGVWSAYQLGKSLYHKAAGELTALMTASCFALILSNIDVRMDAILTAAGVFAAWQGVQWMGQKRLVNALGLALGLAIGFSTKGWSGIIAPVTALFAYLVATKSWRSLLHPQVGLIILAFALFIAPVLYCYYLQFDLHPEKIIRGRSGRSGIAFILWEQNWERFGGTAWGGSGKNDRFLFFHTFLWAFAPWSILAYLALLAWFTGRKNHPGNWSAVAPFGVMALLITFAGYKLPHYLNVILPFAALYTSAYFLNRKERPKVLLTVQTVSAVLLLLPVLVVNTWSFPLRNIFVLLGLAALVVASLYLLMRAQQGKERAITFSVLASTLAFYLLNTNFYPQLLSYQAGNRMAEATRGKVNPRNVYYWPGVNSSSYNFYAGETRKVFADSILSIKDTVWIITNREFYTDLQDKGLPQRAVIRSRDYPTDKLKARFLNPATRSTTLDTMILVRVK